MPYTTTDFLTSVRVRGSIPLTTNANNVNSNQNLLNLATEELHIKLLPLIMSVREEFYVAKVDYAITAGQSSYAVPTRASGVALRDVHIIMGNSINILPAIDPNLVYTTDQGEVQGYYLEHNNLILFPTPSSTSGTLRLRYFMRPNRLAQTTDCAQISAVDPVANTVTVNALPSAWATGTVIDFIKSTVPYQCAAIDQAITNVTGSVLSFAGPLPTILAVGDWVAMAEFTPIPQIPQEFQPVLSQMTVAKALEANGDRDGSTQAFKDVTILQQNALTLITPRVQSQPKRVVGNNWRAR